MLVPRRYWSGVISYSSLTRKGKSIQYTMVDSSASLIGIFYIWALLHIKILVTSFFIRSANFLSPVLVQNWPKNKSTFNSKMWRESISKVWLIPCGPIKPTRRTPSCARMRKDEKKKKSNQKGETQKNIKRSENSQSLHFYPIPLIHISCVLPQRMPRIKRAQMRIDRTLPFSFSNFLSGMSHDYL